MSNVVGCKACVIVRKLWLVGVDFYEQDLLCERRNLEDNKVTSSKPPQIFWIRFNMTKDSVLCRRPERNSER